MIAKLNRGTGFRGLLNYLLGPDKLAVIVGGNMAGQTPITLAREFAAVRMINEKVKTPVWHCSLSLPPGETLAIEQWSRLAHNLLLKLGLGEDRPWVVVKHADRDHQHVHLVTSRTDYHGKVWYGEWEVKRLLRAKTELEHEFDITITPTTPRDRLIPEQQLYKLKREIEAGQNPVLPIQPELSRLIDQAIAACAGNIEIFEQKLNALNVALKLNCSKTTGRISGTSFRLGEHEWLKGSQLGKSYTWQSISKQLSTLQASDHENKRTTAEPQPTQPAPSRDEVTSRDVDSICPPASTTSASVNFDTSAEYGGHSSSAERTREYPGKSINFPDFTPRNAFGPRSDSTDTTSTIKRSTDPTPASPKERRGNHLTFIIMLIERIAHLAAMTFGRQKLYGGKSSFFGQEENTLAPHITLPVKKIASK